MRKENGVVKRGVVFIKEIVPKHALTFVANNIYNENYETMPMKHEWSLNENNSKVDYQWKKEGKTNLFRVTAVNKMYELEKNSETEFITEHYWGYVQVSEKRTNEYEVTHPRWDVYKVNDYHIDVDFEKFMVIILVF